MNRKRTQRPKFRNLGMFSHLPAYIVRFPPSAIVSLLHRVSGVVMFLMLPLVIWLFDASLSSAYSFAGIQRVFEHGFGWVPGWMLKLLLLMLVWSFVHHLLAGLRYLFLDVSHSATDKTPAMRSAKAVLAFSVAMTLLLGLKLFGLY